MKTNKIAQYCCAVLVTAGLGLNIQNAIENYGIGEDSLSLVASGGTGSSGSSSCYEGSFSFATCTYSNAEPITQAIRRCGSFAGKWLLIGKKYISPITGAIYLFWEGLSQLTYQEYDKHKIIREVTLPNDSIVIKEFTLYICTEKKGTSGSNCSQTGDSFEVEGWEY